MKSRFLSFFIILHLFFLITISAEKPSFWGFHAHQLINKMAVFILPPDMMHFFKNNIDYLFLHSTDPDKRRYSVKGEAIKHYIDLDHWGEHPFEELPRNFYDALIKFVEIKSVSHKGDTLLLKGPDQLQLEDSILVGEYAISKTLYAEFIKKSISNKIIDLPISIPTDSLNLLLKSQFNSEDISNFIFDENFTKHGISPYHINKQYYSLREAFKKKDKLAILRIASDLGHYVADAHVPLHTTSNYNGQLSGQEGIHAFWESRLPELFADEGYSYFVGKARYIEDIQKFIWGIVIESNELHHKVLAIEKELSQHFDADKQFSYEERLGRNIRVHSHEYSQAYHKKLGGMVEYRMQGAILALASIWFTAWVDAGQPILDKSSEINWTNSDVKRWEELNSTFQKGHSLGRDCK